jgi:hypothetical protein
MRTQEDDLRRGLMRFVYQLYKKQIPEYGHTDVETDVEAAFTAYHNDPIFYSIYNSLKQGFRELTEIENTRPRA